MSLVANERTKLFATFLNNTAIGCLTAGVVTTIGAIVLDLRGARDHWLLIVLVCLIWLLAALNLPLGAQLVLGRLRDDPA